MTFWLVAGLASRIPIFNTVSRQNNVFLTEKACEHAVQGTGNTKPARRPSRLKTKLPSLSQINFYIRAYTAYVSSPTLTIYHAEARNPQRVLQPSKKRVKGCECLGHLFTTPPFSD